MVNDGPLSNDVELRGGRLLLVEAGNCGKSIGGAATVEPMLVQSPFDCGVDGFASTLRSTGVTGVVDEPQLVVGGGAGVLLELVGHGGARLRVFALAGGAAG